MEIKTICDIHNEMIKRLTEVGLLLYDQKEEAVKIEGYNKLMLAIKDICTMIRIGNEMAMRMETALEVKGKVLEENNLLEKYYKKKYEAIPKNNKSIRK